VNIGSGATGRTEAICWDYADAAMLRGRPNSTAAREHVVLLQLGAAGFRQRLACRLGGRRDRRADDARWDSSNFSSFSAGNTRLCMRHPEPERPTILLGYASMATPVSRLSPLTKWPGWFGLAFGALLAGFVLTLTYPRFGSMRCCEFEIAKAIVAPGGNLDTQLKLFRSHLGRYPLTLAELHQRPVNEPATSRWAGPYIVDSGSLLDPWGGALRYCSPGVHNTNAYDLWSNGRDGQPRTADDVCNWPVAAVYQGWHAGWAAMMAGVLVFGIVVCLVIWSRRRAARARHGEP
jgi:hypothetical protein